MQIFEVLRSFVYMSVQNFFVFCCLNICLSYPLLHQTLGVYVSTVACPISQGVVPFPFTLNRLNMVYYRSTRSAAFSTQDSCVCSIVSYLHLKRVYNNTAFSHLNMSLVTVCYETNQYQWSIFQHFFFFFTFSELPMCNREQKIKT
jgi:hypothetical protein